MVQIRKLISLLLEILLQIKSKINKIIIQMIKDKDNKNYIQIFKIKDRILW